MDLSAIKDYPGTWGVHVRNYNEYVVRIDEKQEVLTTPYMPIAMYALDVLGVLSRVASTKEDFSTLPGMLQEHDLVRLCNGEQWFVARRDGYVEIQFPRIAYVNRLFRGTVKGLEDVTIARLQDERLANILVDWFNIRLKDMS